MSNSIISKFVITNIKTGKPSYVLTAFIVGVAVSNIKLLLSGITIGEFTMSAFSGIDYAAAMGALGSIYSLNKHLNKQESKETKEDNTDA